MKKVIVCWLLCMLLSFSVVGAPIFTDVSQDSLYNDAVTYLCQNGILKGYEDGTFRPDGKITRAEAATVIVRAANIPLTSQGTTVYVDVPEKHWAVQYITAATQAGIIVGDGNGTFKPEGNVTYNQILKMVVCMLGLEKEATQNGGWPLGYVNTAYDKGIIDYTMYNLVSRGNLGDSPALRKDVALYVYNSLKSVEEDSLYVDNKKFTLGMDADCLGNPDEILESACNFKWYVYNTDTYKGFYAAGVDKNKIVALAATGTGFSYNGYSCGDVMANNRENTVFYTDSNDRNIIHSVLLLDKNYNLIFWKENYHTIEQLMGESKMNFHFTNAFRVFHNMNVLKWSDKAAMSAQLHSEDMAENNYFSHDNLKGESSSQRMIQQGIKWRGCGENIAAGNARFLGFHAFDGWVNSAGHRKNMLGQYDYLGVGIAYNFDSDYDYYHTQNFYR